MTKYLTQSTLLTYLCIGLIILFILIVDVTARFSQSPAIGAVLNGEALLECHMHDGIRVIDPDKIKYFHEGTWVFEDGGYAKSCRIIRK